MHGGFQNSVSFVNYWYVNVSYVLHKNNGEWLNCEVVKYSLLSSLCPSPCVFRIIPAIIVRLLRIAASRRTPGTRCFDRTSRECRFFLKLFCPGWFRMLQHMMSEKDCQAEFISAYITRTLGSRIRIYYKELRILCLLTSQMLK